MYSIRLDGDIQPLLDRIEGLANVDKAGLNAAISDALRSSTVQRFRSGEAPDGQKWKKSRRASAEGGATLVKSAELRNSIKSKSNSSGFAVGTNKIYAATHQLGAEGRSITIKAKTSKGLVFKIDGQWIRKKKVTVKVNIPARPFLGLSADDMEEIRGTIDDYFAEG